MAERISYQVPPPKIGPDAHEELERLLQTLHEHGVLRFANDIVGANTKVAEVVVNGLCKEGSLNAMQNLAALMMALSTIPPNQFYRVTFALKDCFERIGNYPDEGHGDGAPGVTGALKLLNDEQLWKAITPLLEGLKVFAERLEQPVDKPISDFTGKPTSA